MIEIEIKKVIIGSCNNNFDFRFFMDFFWYPELVLDRRIEELKKEGIDVEVIAYDVFYLDVTSTSPEVVFAEKQSWSAFKQDAMTFKSDLGSVTVSVDRYKRTFVFTWNETTYYYYQVT